MSLFFGRVESRAMADWRPSVDADGFVRDPESRAAYLTPVYAAWRHVIDTGSTLPLKAYRRVSETERVQIPLPPLLADLDDTLAGGPGLDNWIGQALYGLLRDGNAVGLVQDTSSYGKPTRVRWLQRHQWSWDKVGHRWVIGGEAVDSSLVVHIPWVVPIGKRFGLSPIEHAAAAIGAGLSAQDYADVKTGVPPAIFKNTERKVDKAVAEKASAQLLEKLSKNRPFTHGNDWDLSFPAIPPNHAAFIETLKLSANQIAAVYGIDPTEIGGTSANSLTYSTEELRQIRRIADLRPYFVRLENAIGRMLPARQFVRFNLDAPIRVDLKTRVEVERIQVGSGLRSVDEVRLTEDQPPVPGGDYHNVPAPGRSDPASRD